MSFLVKFLCLLIYASKHGKSGMIIITFQLSRKYTSPITMIKVGKFCGLTPEILVDIDLSIRKHL